MTQVNNVLIILQFVERLYFAFYSCYNKQGFRWLFSFSLRLVRKLNEDRAYKQL